MKKWILNLGFVKEALMKSGVEAFRLAQKDILDGMQDDLDKKAEELAKKKLEDLLSPIDWSKVVSVNQKTKQVFLGGQPIDAATMANLKAERAFILESNMWRIINESAKAEAHLSMFVKGETLDDMKKGKTMLFILSQQNNIIDAFK